MGDSKNTGETLDMLFDGKLKLYQSRGGYRFSLDAILLAYFATLRDGDKVADLGTGNGVIPLMLAYLHPSLSITGVEIQEAMVERAKRNVNLNRLATRVSAVHADISSIAQKFGPESFTAVVCNPPYRRATSGRISPNAEKKVARHEIRGALEDFLKAGAYLLPIKGRMAVVYPAARAIDLLMAMRKAGVEPKRLRAVHSYAAAEASLVLVEGVKGGKSEVKVHSPLVVYQEEKRYTAEVEAMLSGKPPTARGNELKDGAR